MGIKNKIGKNEERIVAWTGISLGVVILAIALFSMCNGCNNASPKAENNAPIASPDVKDSGNVGSPDVKDSGNVGSPEVKDSGNIGEMDNTFNFDAGMSTTIILLIDNVVLIALFLAIYIWSFKRIGKRHKLEIQVVITSTVESTTEYMKTLHKLEMENLDIIMKGDVPSGKIIRRPAVPLDWRLTYGKGKSGERIIFSRGVTKGADVYELYQLTGDNSQPNWILKNVSDVFEKYGTGKLYFFKEGKQYNESTTSDNTDGEISKVDDNGESEDKPDSN